MSVDQRNDNSGACRTETLGRAEFHGQGIQHTGPGSFNVRGDVYIGAESHGNDGDDELLRALRTTDPRGDKTRIVRQKGGLLVDSYRWILDHDDFQQWRDGEETQLLWIKGDPGKGKTMLLCGIIDELEKAVEDHIAYFFCQATDARLNNAMAVLKGLMYLLLVRQPTLAARVRDRYGHVDEKLLREVNGWDTLCNMLLSLLQEPGVQTPYLIVDGLDECQTGFSELLWLIVRLSSSRARVLVSSRNWPSIDDGLSAATLKVPLCLELNTQAISAAVDTYIGYKVEQLERSKKYDEETRKTVQQYLASNADGTFLWVALVCQELSDPKVRKWHTVGMLNDFLTEFPSGLDALYVRMAEQIFSSRDAELCRQVLAVASVVYRPVALTEILSLVESPGDFPDDAGSLREIIELCGSFLTLREGIIHFVHQSAKDFLMKKVLDKILPHGHDIEHNMIATRSVQMMSRRLRRNIYNLPSPGFSIDRVKAPDPDPLGPVQYGCMYWADHLRNGMSRINNHYLQDGGLVHRFLAQHFLHWLEALSLLRNIGAGIVAAAQLLSMLRVDLQDEQGSRESDLAKLAHDAWRFIRYHKTGIEAAPLQVYVSALVFSPISSVVRNLFRKEEPEWMLTMPLMEEDWSACLQTLDGHSDGVKSVAFSPDGRQLASGSRDGTVRLWDAATGENLRTLGRHSDGCVYLVVFSPSGRQLASVSGGIRVWDAATGGCLRTLEGRDVRSVAFSSDGRQIVSESSNGIHIWNAVTGECLTMLTGYKYPVYDSVRLVAFSPDATQLALGSDRGLQICDATTYDSFWIPRGCYGVMSVVFSSDGKQVATASSDRTIRVWDAATGRCLRTLKYDHHGCWEIKSVAFSPNSRHIASESNSPVRIWDTETGECLWTLKYGVMSIAFSPDSRQVVTGFTNRTVRIWDAATGKCLKTLKGHDRLVHTVRFSPDGRHVVSGSHDGTVRLWDAVTGGCLSCIRALGDDGHYTGPWAFSPDGYSIRSVAFSPDGRHVALGFTDGTAQVWNAATGHLQTPEGYDGEGHRILWDPARLRIDSVVYDPRAPSFGDTSHSMQNNNALLEGILPGMRISSDNSWILNDGERALWLPTEYRPFCIASSGKVLALGYRSGRVLLFRFS